MTEAWETFLVVLVLYTAWVSPFEFGFLEKPKGPLSITDNVVNGFFAIDIVLTFFVAYIDKTTYLLVDDPKQIAWKYASTWLTFDVISTIPSELARKISLAPLQSYGLFNMLRLWVYVELVPCLPDWRKIGTSTIFGFDVGSLFVSPCLQFTAPGASIIFLLRVIMTEGGHGLEHPWVTSLNRAYGSDM